MTSDAMTNAATDGPAIRCDWSAVPCMAAERGYGDAIIVLEEAAELLAAAPALNLANDHWFGVRSGPSAARPIEVTIFRRKLEIRAVEELETPDWRLTLPLDVTLGGHSVDRALATLASWLASARSAHRWNSDEGKALRASLTTAAKLTLAVYAAAGIATEGAIACSAIGHAPLTPRFLRRTADGRRKPVDVLLTDMLAAVAPPFRVLGRTVEDMPMASAIETIIRQADVDASERKRLLCEIPTPFLSEVIARVARDAATEE